MLAVDVEQVSFVLRVDIPEVLISPACVGVALEDPGCCFVSKVHIVVCSHVLKFFLSGWRELL